MGTAFQQSAVDSLLVSQSQALGGQGQQRRPTTRDQANHQIVSGEAVAQSHHALGRLQARIVWHRVRSLQYLDALLQASGPGWRVVVTGDHHTRQGRIGRPQSFQRMGHGACSLASTQHQGAATRHRWQAVGHVQERLSAGHGRVKQMAQKESRILLR